MNKKLLLNFLVLITYISVSQSFTAKYNFASVSGSCSNNCLIDPTPVPVVTGLNFSPFSASGTGSAPNASGRFSFQGWPLGAANGVDTYTAFTGSLSPVAYYEVTLAPQAGYTLALSGISFSMRRSGTGVRNYAVRSSLDGYAANLPASIGGNVNLSVIANTIFFWNFDAASTSADQTGSMITPDSAFYNLTDTVSFRFYAWNSENGSLGTFSIDSVLFMGQAFNTPPVITGLRDFPGVGNGMRLLPNPSNDGLVSLQTTEPLLSLEILDCLGSVVLRQAPASTSHEVELNLDNLPAGTYFVKAFLPDGPFCRRLVICK